jgi:hypothetical protein
MGRRCAIRSALTPEALAAPRAQSDGADEPVDLPVPLAVDHASGLALGGSAGGAGKTTPLVPVLDSFDVPEITRQPIEL